MTKGLVIECAPHIKDDDTTAKIMWAVVVALIPAGLMGVYYFGLRALIVILVCAVSCVLFEFLFQLFAKKNISSFDGSAFLTGILLAYNLPSNIPLWMCVLGSAFSIIIVKQLFGGLGHNIFNPALAGRVFLLLSFPVNMTSWPVVNLGKIFSKVDVITSATPLGIFKENLPDKMPSYWDLFIGNRGGCIGEVCILALLIGAIFLLWRRCIKLWIPLSYVASVALLAWVLGGKNGFFTGDPLFHVLAGGLVLGAFFMATDMVTSPLTKKGMIIFGIGCGVVTMVIRLYGGYPEGVSFSILLMNAVVPIIDKHTRQRVYGKGKFSSGEKGVCNRLDKKQK